MRLLSRLVIALVICLVAVALPSAPVQGQCYGPVIRLSPGSGVPGTQLIVEGQSFEADKYIDIYYDGVIMSEGRKTSPDGEFSIAFTVPEGCKGSHEVLVEAGVFTKETHFNATPGLTVTPDKGPQGTTVTVAGHGFVQNEDGIELMYYIDQVTYEVVAEDIKADAEGCWHASFDIPASDRGEHRIDARGNFSQTYEVKDATFKVMATISMDKSSGTIGDSVVMTGTEFAPYEQGIRILFNGQAVATGIEADGQGGWGEAFDVPTMAEGNYTVTAEGAYTLRQDLIGLSFEIKPYILLSRYEGYVGMNVTVTGYGFLANTNVSIMYDGSQRTTAATDGQGDFEGSFSVPPGPHGQHEVTIGYSAASTASATFFLESDPPGMAQLVSPALGARVGLKSNVAPTFQWAAVSDDSGVSYNFQLSASPDVTSSGEFAQPMISASGLTGTGYTATEDLPQGTYYWIVQAVDGAQNQGGWSAPRAFRVGLMPLWAYIAIIVAIVVGVIALIAALVRRRRYYY
jgi:hypothetical protein